MVGSSTDHRSLGWRNVHATSLYPYWSFPRYWLLPPRVLKRILPEDDTCTKPPVLYARVDSGLEDFHTAVPSEADSVWDVLDAWRDTRRPRMHPSCHQVLELDFVRLYNQYTSMLPSDSERLH